jgi:hypothetical protein
VNRAGWSVLVKGRAVELTTPDDLQHASRLPLELWALGEKTHWIRIVPREITGRRIHRGDRDRGPTRGAGPLEAWFRQVFADARRSLPDTEVLSVPEDVFWRLISERGPAPVHPVTAWWDDDMGLAVDLGQFTVRSRVTRAGDDRDVRAHPTLNAPGTSVGQPPST